jgi:uncharacterized protein (TIGR03032 family)
VPGRLDRVVFLLGPPESGGRLLAESLSRASGVWHSSGADFALVALPEARQWESHRLRAANAEGREEEIETALLATLRTRDGRPLGVDDQAGTALVWSARSALRVQFLARAFPAARFVLCLRDPAAATADMLRSWRSGRMVSAPDLPGWEGPAWSLPLIEGWQELNGRPLEEIVVEQWTALAQQALDDLEELSAESWAVCNFSALLEQPRAELVRLCEFLDLDYDQAILSPVEESARALRQSPPQPPAELLALLDRTEPVTARLEEVSAPAAATGRTQPEDPRASPFRSAFSGSFSRLLAETGGSLLISTYQSGRLICARTSGGMVNTHLRSFDKPMGIAVTRDRFALGTRTEVWDFRDMPTVAAKIDPPGSHDACYLPRNRHLTGDILVHELAFDRDGTLWGVATAFSALVTFDNESSFVPRWRPPFITALEPGDRCHLNGLCLRDGRPTYVSALGESDTPGGWRRDKATGGRVIDIESGETIVDGLSMPHSPRWHDDRLWLLESGLGELITVDLESGTTETVAELPGFTRGLAIWNELAFIGLSQIRESSTFGDLPLTERLKERICGVWIVDLISGETRGWLRFDDLVQEIFDVALLPGAHYPEIAETASSAAATSFILG